MNDYDQHESGQLRLGTEGDQIALLPLPDAAIPASDGPELASPALEAPELDPASWTIPDDGWSDGGTPYSDEELNYTRAEADAEARARLSR